MMSTYNKESLWRPRRIELFVLLLIAVISWQNPTAKAFSTSVTWTRNNQDQRTSTELYGFTRADKTKKPKQRRPREKNVRKLSAANDLMTSHKERLSTAGKEGTLRFTDPNMIFIGNLNFTATEDQLKSLILPHVPSPWEISKISIVRDWKTGDSKGYAFVKFTQPIFATLCLQELNQKEFLGRRLKVKAAQSKADSPLRVAQRKEQERLKAERRAANPPPPPPPPKHENAEFLAMLDKDLIVPGMIDFGGEEEDDDDDDEVDGWDVPGRPAPKGFG